MPSELNIVSTSAGDMFLGAFLPGILLVGLYMAYILVTGAYPPVGAQLFHTKVNCSSDHSYLKVALAYESHHYCLIFLVLGSIIAGIATVNQPALLLRLALC